MSDVLAFGKDYKGADIDFLKLDEQEEL